MSWLISSKSSAPKPSQTFELQSWPKVVEEERKAASIYSSSIESSQDNLQECYTNTDNFFRAIESGSLFKVLPFLIFNIRVNNLYKEDLTPLMLSAKIGCAEITKALLKAEARVNQVNKNGESALMFAAKSGNLEVAKVLLEAGSNVNEMNTNGETAIMFAANCNEPRMIKLLLDSGAKRNHKTTYNKSVLYNAISNGRIMLLNYYPLQEEKMTNLTIIHLQF